ncbi:LytR/AlgR family response regulator transcription factor [Enterocloster bolteae]|uniref:LytR/AlgR family response regulator transcription factor n=1 Tax=Enterocloster bolteae TaxID=208479 RepID=UPI00210A37C4|nr:LytTR family DNA-binding domain-containing protein [Enterocloster bolteae]MCQ5146152.1 LytTR family DNA-binding domain-containing protein [Enterocloster bolteae]
MYQIVICDDCQDELDTLKGFVKKFFTERELPYSIVEYTSPTTLLRDLKNGVFFDLFFLDIMMPGIDGISIGRQIRRLDAESPIIYLTNSPDYALQSYEVRAMNYILKPCQEEKLFCILQNGIRSVNRNRSSQISVRVPDGTVNLMLTDLVCIHYNARRIEYICSDGSVILGVTLRGSFEDETAPLAKQFPVLLKCSASVIVNMRYIWKLSAGRITMRDGKEYSIPRRMNAQVKRRYMDYLMGGV